LISRAARDSVAPRWRAAPWTQPVQADGLKAWRWSRLNKRSRRRGRRHFVPLFSRGSPPVAYTSMAQIPWGPASLASVWRKGTDVRTPGQPPATTRGRLSARIWSDPRASVRSRGPSTKCVRNRDDHPTDTPAIRERRPVEIGPRRPRLPSQLGKSLPGTICVQGAPPPERHRRHEIIERDGVVRGSGSFLDEVRQRSATQGGPSRRKTGAWTSPALW